MQYQEVMLASDQGEVLRIRVSHPAGGPSPFDTEAFLAYYNEEKVALLHAAFDAVKPLGNWKGPINAVIRAEGRPQSDFDLIVEAIAFMGCGTATVKSMPGGNVRIVAPGYYAESGA